MTDHDSLTGAVRFSKACKAAGVKPIFGAELTLETVDRRLTSPRSPRTPPVTGTSAGLISAAHLTNERGEPRTTLEAIAERAEGLFVLSGCERGEVARLAAAGRLPEARAGWPSGGGMRSATATASRSSTTAATGTARIRDRLLAIARDTGITAGRDERRPLPRPPDAGTHEVLHAIKEIVPLSRTQALRPNSEYYLKSPAEMRALFTDAPEAADETLRIAEACDYDLDLDQYHFPDMSMVANGNGAAAVLRKRCLEGADRRFGRITTRGRGPAPARARHDHRGASKWADDPSGFAAFFLLVADIVDHTEAGARHPLRVPGERGRLARLLRARHLRRRPGSLRPPVRALHERAPRGAPRHRRRRRVAPPGGGPQLHPRYLRRRADRDVLHGRHVPGPHGAIREVGKALGLPPDEIGLVAKSFPHISASGIPAAIERLPELTGTNLSEGRLEQMFELCMQIDGFPRHLALHPSGRDPVVGRSRRPGPDAGVVRRLHDAAGRQGRRRGARAREARRPRGADAVVDRARPGRDRPDPRRRPRPRLDHARRRGRLQADPHVADARLLPDRVAGPARAPRAAPAADVRGPDRRDLAVPAGPGEVRHGEPVPRPAPRLSVARVPRTRVSSRSSGRPAASSCTTSN